MRAVCMTIIMVMLILPAAFAEDPIGYPTCAQYNAGELVGTSILDISESNVDAKIKENLNESPHVIICMVRIGKSSGHGPFGLLTWDQRKIASADAFKLGDDQYAIVNIVARTELKAPLGYWQVEQISRTEEAEITQDFDKTLANIWEKVLEENSEGVHVGLYKND